MLKPVTAAGHSAANDEVVTTPKCLSHGTARGWFPTTRWLEVGTEGRLHVAGKEGRHDEWEAPVEPYVPYGRVRTAT